MALAAADVARAQVELRVPKQQVWQPPSSRIQSVKLRLKMRHIEPKENREGRCKAAAPGARRGEAAPVKRTRAELRVPKQLLWRPPVSRGFAHGCCRCWFKDQSIG